MGSFLADDDFKSPEKKNKPSPVKKEKTSLMERIKQKSAAQQEMKVAKVTEHWQKMSASQSHLSQDPDFVADVELGDLGQRSEVSHDFAATEREMREGFAKTGSKNIGMDEGNVSMEFPGSEPSEKSDKNRLQPPQKPNVFNKSNKPVVRESLKKERPPSELKASKQGTPKSSKRKAANQQRSGRPISGLSGGLAAQATSPGGGSHRNHVNLDSSHYDVVDGGHVHHHGSGHDEATKYRDVFAMLNPKLEPIMHMDKPFNLIA